MIKVNAFKGRDNETVFKVIYAGKPFDPVEFGVTKTEVIAGGQTASSDDGNASWSGSQLTVKFGALNVDSKMHTAQVLVYTSAHPNGIVIAGPGLASEISLVVQ